VKVEGDKVTVLQLAVWAAQHGIQQCYICYVVNQQICCRVLVCFGTLSNYMHAADCPTPVRLLFALQVLPNKGAGPRALYAALGGKLPSQATAAAAAPPMP
jgi:hypothetical protein